MTPKRRRCIRYCPAPPGSGKTHLICQRIVHGVKKGRKYLLVQYSKELINQTAALLKYLYPGIKVFVFHEDVVDDAVKEALAAHLRSPPIEGHVVITTWASFVAMEDVPNRSGWRLIVDEAPDVLRVTDLSIPNEHFIVTQHLDVRPNNAKYARLLDSSAGGLKKILDNRSNDEIWKVFRDLATLVLSSFYQTYVITASYQNLIRNRGKNRKLSAFSILQPIVFGGFQSVLILGARFEETLLYKVWSNLGVLFRRDRSLTRSLKYTEHTNGHLISFHYACSANWSKAKAQSKDNTIVEDMIVESKKLFGESPYLYVANNGCMKSKLLKRDDLARPLPGYSHGRNDFQDCSNVLVIAAYNHMSCTTSFIKDTYRVSSTDQRVALMCHQVYQSINRCSIRNELSNEPVKIVLPEQSVAEWCSDVFPGSKCFPMHINALPLKRRLGRKPKHQSSNARKRASYNKIKEEEAFARSFLDEVGRIVRDEFP
jgi:hypothetical protein